MIVFSFCFFLLLFTAVGLLSLVKTRRSSLDYLLAGREIKPWLVGLSAVATNNSGYMFTGMIGFTYAVGLSSVWLMIGWILGDLTASFFIHKKLRIITEKTGQHSFSGVLSRWNGTDYRHLRRVCGLISIIFLGAYAAAQLNAGSKALHVLLGWDPRLGAVIGSVIVIGYCFAGGIRASIWTDAVQSVVMIVSMTLLFFCAVYSAGGFEASFNSLKQVSPDYMKWFSPEVVPIGGWIGAVLFVAGWFFAGFGVVGQPHIMIRFMTLDHPENISSTRFYYYTWFTVFYSITIGVGLMARLHLPQISQFDAELALPMMSMAILPQILVGVMLAGLFAATISTADSLILSCSASLTRDFFSGTKDNYLLAKLGTLLVNFLALWIALAGNKSVFQLVLYAWAVLGASFGPLLLVYCFNRRVSEGAAVLMVLAGTVVTLMWSEFGLSKYIYEIVPGMTAGALVFLMSRIRSKQPASE